MKRVYLRFYEELNDLLPPEKRKIKFEHAFIDRTSVKGLIESLGIPHTEVDLILVNGKSVDFYYLINDADEISVYPLFESFDISDVQHLRPEPLREPKFILDVHLGKLARYLRMAGFDAVYENNFTGYDLISISLNERRTILTMDREILKRNEVTHGYRVRNENPEDQLKEVIERFHLNNLIKEFTRCLVCNSLLVEIEKEKILDRLPPKVIERQNDFYFCPKCKRFYWRGSHYEKMKSMISSLKNIGM